MPIVRPAGIVSVSVVTAVVAAVPVLLTCKVYDAGTPTEKAATLADFAAVSCGRYRRGHATGIAAGTGHRPT